MKLFFHARFRLLTISLISTIIITASFNSVFSQTNTYTDAGSGIWNDVANWSLGHTPTSGEDVVITKHNFCIIDDGDHACASLTLNAPTTNGLATDFAIGDGFTLTVSGDVTIIGGSFNTRISTLYIGDGSIDGVATLVIQGNLNINAANNVRAAVDMSNGASLLYVGGNIQLTHASLKGTLTCPTGTVYFNGTGAQTFAIGDGTGSYCNITYNDIIISNTSNTVSVNSSNENVVNASSLAGNLTIQSNATLDNGGLAMVGATGKTFQVDGKYKRSGAVDAAAFPPTGFSTISLGSSSTIEYAGTGTGANAQTITAYNYANLTSSSTGDRILASSGTVGVSGTFTPGTNTYTITGSTIDFNGTGAQTIAAFNYNNLTVSGARTTNSVTLENGGTIGVAATFTPSATFTSGNYINTGNTISFNGTSAQVISSSSGFTYNNLTINNAAGVSINGASAMQTVAGTLAKTSGTLTTNSLLTIASTASGDGRIDGGAGSVSGNVVVQRYTSNNATPGNRMFGAPTTNATVQDIINALPTYSSYIYSFNESGSAYAARIGADAITPSRAITAYIKIADLPATVNFNGPTNEGTVNFSGVTRAGATYPGYNLVSNPYPSQIDWDADAGWTRNNMSATMYVWDCTISDYRGWTASTPGGGAAINGGSNVIASSQGFWVEATAGYVSGDFQCTESVKTTGGSFYKTTPIVQNSLKLKVMDSANTEYYDEAMIRFVQTADKKFEPTTVDARRLYSSTSLIPNLSTLSSDSVNLAINTYPDLSQKYSIPVVVKVNKTGNYSISAQDIQLPASACILLEDIQTGEKVDLKTTASYSFTMAKGISNTPRFLIHFSPPTHISTSCISCNGQADGAIIAEGQADGPWSYTWKDNKGNILKTNENVNVGDTLSGLSSGIYFLTVSNTRGYCNIVVDSVFVNAPDALSLDVISTNTTCNEINNGEAEVNVSGGTYPYTYTWSNGDTINSISNLAIGNYSITVTDKNNCSETKNIVISETVTSADFTVNMDTVYLSKGGKVIFTNNSTGANKFIWDFGDGTMSSTDVHPTHTYSREGDYAIKLISDGGACKDSMEYKITVMAAPLAIAENGPEKEVSVINQDNGALVQFNFSAEHIVQVKVYNILAQKIWETKNLRIKNDALPINLGGQMPGIYFINFSVDGKFISRKFNFTK